MSSEPGARAGAWIITIAGRDRVAVGDREMVHLIGQSVALHPVPRAAAHCRCAVLWEDQVLPVVDLAVIAGYSRYGSSDRAVAGVERLLGIVAYSAHGGADVGKVALMLEAVPERFEVADDMACRHPDELGTWARWAISGFRHPRHGAVPILNLPRIFASPLMELER
jgi:chemotaxis signal transduction protein